ncbi:MAG: TonB-dependent receptor [Paludibacteraceae bacterium]|nr:TonB-dependent receptor [Paludibacteraceae bacterium]
MRTHFNLFFSILIIGSLMPLNAAVHGVVLDEQGNPLIGVNVWWAGTMEGTTTNIVGEFKILPVRQTKQLVSSFIGYRNDTTTVTGSEPLTIVLFPEDEHLDEVTISARRLSVLRSRYSAFDESSFGLDELSKAACCNLSESFETSASVDVSYADAATGAKQIRLLGLSGKYVQLLTENTPAVRGLAQNFGMEYIPGPWMQSVQVSKGTSSVINGYEAMTGQINIEYLKPQLQNPIAVNLMLNSELHAEANLTGGWEIPIPNDPLMGSLATGILAHYQEGAWGMDEDMDGMLDMPLNRNLNLLNRWFYRNDRYTFQFLVRGLHDERHGGQRENYMSRKKSMMLPDNPYLIDLRTDRIEGLMKNGFIFNEESDMSLGIITAASYHDQHNIYGPRDWTASQTNAYLNVIFQNTWTSGDISHKLSAGTSYNFDRYREFCFNDDLSRWELTVGLFGEYTLSAGKQLSLIAGLRGDWSTLYGPFATPRFNIRYAPFEWWTLRASAGMGYRSPNLIADHAAYLPSTRVWNFSQMDRSSKFASTPPQEVAVNTGFSSVWDIPLGSRTLQLSAEYYYTHFLQSVAVDLDRSTQAVDLLDIKTVHGKSYSHNAQVEASMEVLRGWTITAAFRYNDVRQTSWNNATGQYELREKVLQNRFKGILSTSYQTPLKKWQFDLTAQFNGPGRMPDGVVATTQTGYLPVLADAGNSQYYMKNGSMYHKWYPQLLAQITKYWRTCSLYVGAENMTNYTQEHPIAGTYDDGMVIMDGSTPYDASMLWAPARGWKVYAGFRWSLDKPEK